MQAEVVKSLARECGFELAGIARAGPLPEAAWYLEWVQRGMAAGMAYLAGHRAAMRADPRTLLASARSIICVGKLYNTAKPYSTGFQDSGRAWISRYAWGKDYHGVVRAGLKRLAGKLFFGHAFEPQSRRGQLVKLKPQIILRGLRQAALLQAVARHGRQRRNATARAIASAITRYGARRTRPGPKKSRPSAT